MLFHSCIACIEDVIANLEVEDSRTFYLMSVARELGFVDFGQIGRETSRTMEIVTVFWFLGGFFGQLSVLVIRLRAILMLMQGILSYVQLP